MRLCYFKLNFQFTVTRSNGKLKELTSFAIMKLKINLISNKAIHKIFLSYMSIIIIIIIKWINYEDMPFMSLLDIRWKLVFNWQLTVSHIHNYLNRSSHVEWTSHKKQQHQHQCVGAETKKIERISLKKWNNHQACLWTHTLTHLHGYLSLNLFNPSVD